ncbi:SDR family oxidoreductase [Sediminitomix flava]|uniref:Short-subunit dehydrogenase n=1 Tax=Sediminitomix flava TaxID=379075 RepID=A0A315ZGN2_SEDFL|nr:SDR family oxidoreductase [Sediminitomix flava]PWJ44746.1 short-subunit dehydrogenase [Sediminitomix flava]
MSKTVFITGISRGIGKTIAEECLKKGYTVIGTCRKPESVSDKLEGTEYLPLDMSDEKSIEACWEQLKDRKIDVLVNNAGQSQIGPVEETPMEKYRYLFEVNFFGIIKLTQYFLPQMRERRSGTIINIGSLTGRFPLPYYSSYCATKFALSGYSQSLRSEMIDFGVKVVLIEPNDIKTTIVPDFNCREEAEYFPYADNIRQSVKAKMSVADSTTKISDKVMFAIESAKTNPVYVAGGNASFMAFIQRVIPRSLAEKVIRKTYGLGK